MRFLSLFSGVGGFDIGLERSGMQCVGQVEIDPTCQKVLAKHWPLIPRFEDIQNVTAELVFERCGRVDAIVGGFPCQDISIAGACTPRTGIKGARSGLWKEYLRLIRDIRPGVVIAENSPNLLRCGFDEVLSDLAACGYDAEWEVLSACIVGFTHTRERLFVVAYPDGVGWDVFGDGDFVGQIEETLTQSKQNQSCWLSVLDKTGSEAIPDVLRIPNGILSELDIARIKALGNAVVPQLAETIGRRVLALQGSTRN